ncbi:ATP-binding protein [uncultured Cellulomonas sp.]|uniref:ATP-binding protein n=1 Tax=uncultured Cellulomonas sp. TaxID=189682 RepID=UPI00262CA8D9|nr:ATP-binding protein [uncultured Cellulomonas sp.]
MTPADGAGDETGGPLATATRSVRLPPDLGSARRARQLLREVLSDADRLDCLDAAELACTELVTNAVLHAHTDVEVTVDVARSIRVAVRDFNPMPPLQRHYDLHATTGRGLALVAAVSDSHGVEDLGPAGKTLWFTVGAPEPARSDGEMVAAWHTADWTVDAWSAAATASAPVRTIRLVGVPPTLWLAARQHDDALLRELAFYRASHPVDVDVAAADRARSLISDAVVAVIEAAQRRGEAQPALPSGHPSPLPAVPPPFDVELEVTEGTGADAAAMQDALDVAEELAAAGQLLARPGLPEVVAVRDWACEQVQAQLGGVDASPWPGTDSARFMGDVDVDAAHALRTFTTEVRTSDRRVVAADDANRIVAVSAPLAGALGWDVDDLVGRRIVALIPPHLREAHVSGFTRHLTTGQAHVLGVPLVLPVLRRDGTEVDCTFLIEQRRPTTGRAVYVAFIDPVSAALAEGLHRAR